MQHVDALGQVFDDLLGMFIGIQQVVGTALYVQCRLQGVAATTHVLLPRTRRPIERPERMREKLRGSGQSECGDESMAVGKLLEPAVACKHAHNQVSQLQWVVRFSVREFVGLLVAFERILIFAYDRQQQLLQSLPCEVV